MVKILDFTPSEMGSVMGRVFVSGSISASVFSGVLQTSSILFLGVKGTLTYSELLFAEYILSCKLDRNYLKSRTEAQAFGNEMSRTLCLDCDGWRELYWVRIFGAPLFKELKEQCLPLWGFWA